MIDKNIGFVNPPSPFLIEERVFPSLGILRVATTASRYSENVKFLDLTNSKDYYKDIDDYIIDNKLNILCFTSTTPQIGLVMDLCRHIRKAYDKKIKIILGGPHVTLIYTSINSSTDDIKKISFNHLDDILKIVDIIAIGDGEETIKKIIDEGCDDDKKILENDDIGMGHFVDDFIVNRDFIDIQSYKYLIDGKKSTSLISQLGCPFKCEFCSGRNSKYFNRVQQRSVDNILEEIDMLYKKYGYEGFMFYDDELNLNRKRFHELLYSLIDYQNKNNVSFNFRGFTRSDLLTNEQAVLMKECGFKWLLIGFESGSNRILKNMNKRTTVDINNKAFDIAKHAGLKIKALMSIGHPGESEKTIKDTIDWLKKVKPDETDTTIISIYPGCNYFNKSIKISDEHLKFTSEYTGDVLYIRNIDFLKSSNFYKSKSGDYVSYVHTDYMSENDVINARDEVEKITK